MKKLGIILAVILFFVVIVESLVIIGLLLDRGTSGFLSDDSIAVVRIDDVIIDAKVFLDRIDLYRDREDVKAIVLRMETPGGSVAASQELANAVRRLREEDGKIVVTSVANVGASGGYYAACRSDRIVVNPGSLVGSIGVLMEHVEFHELASKIGIDATAITSGKMKDAGSAMRPMKPEERAVFQELIDDVFEQFRGEVLESRWSAIAAAAKLAADDTAGIEAALDKVADGRALTGAQAVRVGLADELGDLEDALHIASELAGIQGEPHVIYDKPEDPWEGFREIFGLQKMIPNSVAAPLMRPKGLWYLYR